MPRILRLDLTAEQRQELEAVRDHHPVPYVREKAAALLKIAAGQVAAQVAQHGLLKPRDTDTVYRWIRRYQAAGIAGFRVGQGRGRKPAFPPHSRRQRRGQG